MEVDIKAYEGGNNDPGMKVKERRFNGLKENFGG